MFVAISSISVVGMSISLWMIIIGVCNNEPRIWNGGILLALFFFAILAIMYYIANLPTREDK